MAAFRHPRWRIWNIAGGEIGFALTDLPPELRETISMLAEQERVVVTAYCQRSQVFCADDALSESEFRYREID